VAYNLYKNREATKLGSKDNIVAKEASRPDKGNNLFDFLVFSVKIVVFKPPPSKKIDQS